MTFVIGTIKRCQKHNPIIFSYSPVELCGIKCVSLPVSPFPSFKPRDVCTASRTTSVNKLQRIFQIKFGCLLLRMRALRIQIVRSHWCTVYLQGRGSITLLHWELRLSAAGYFNRRHQMKGLPHTACEPTVLHRIGRICNTRHVRFPPAVRGHSKTTGNTV